MSRRTTPKTDFGTVILHWTLVALMAISVATGLRIATTSPFDFAWLHALDQLLPYSMVWTAHMPAAIALFGLALAYTIYIRRAGLARRIRPDRVRLMGIFRTSQARWGAINTLFIWILLLTLLSQLATGCLIYLGYGGSIIEQHRLGTWILLAGAVGHVAGHWALGGIRQVSRMFRPSRLPPSVPQFDPFDLLVDQQQRTESNPSPTQRSTRRSPHDVKLQSHPLAVAMAIALVGTTVLTFVGETMTRESLYIRRIGKDEAPVLDGDVSDPIWRSAARVVVLTNQGANFDGAGTSEVEVRAVHDGETAYFSFVWSDPTRSLKHLPLIKKSDGWYLVQEKYDSGDEHEYHEDKFAVLLTKANVLLAGDRTFHAGRAPVDGKPATFSGRGLHYTTDNSIVDVWQWKAAHGGLLGFVDDGHFGPPAEPTKEQIEGHSPYKGGYALDPGSIGYEDNFEPRGPGGYQRPVQPKRLPKDWRLTWSAMGRIDIHPDVSESEGSRWWMTQAESVPYSPAHDAQFPINALIPGVIVSGDYTGDRADVRCAARWAAGRWTLEVARALDTRSPYDVPIASGVFMRVSAFDRSQIRHTRHIRPIRLEVQ